MAIAITTVRQPDLGGLSSSLALAYDVSKSVPSAALIKNVSSFLSIPTHYTPVSFQSEPMKEILETLTRIEKQNLEILARLDRLECKPPQKESWSPEELAVALHRKPFTVREWCRLGRVPAEKDKYSRLWRVSDKEAQRLLAGGGLQPVLAA